MTTPDGILAEFANVLILLRYHPERKEELRLAFGRFANDLPSADHVLTVSPTGFTWDQAAVPASGGDVSVLHDLLRAHGVGEIRFPIGLMTSTLLALFRTFAAPPGTYGSFDHLRARLDAAGCGMIPVLPPPEPAPAPKEASGAPAKPSGRLSGPSAPPGRVSAPTTPPPVAVDDEGHLSALGPDALTEAKVGMMHFVTLETHALGPTDEIVHDLADAKSDDEVAAALNQLVTVGEAAARQSEWREVLKAAHGLVMLENSATETRSFGIALRRLLPRSVLERVVWLAGHGDMKQEAVQVLRRMGADGTEVLLHALVNAENVGERRAYFSAMKEMTEGGELLIHMLSHDQWFVVRNVAELCGELKLDRAVPALARQVEHDDERVRRSVAGALGRIGGSGAIEPLRKAMKDSSAAVRLAAVKDLDGPKNKNLAMTLAVAADQESKSDVQREMYVALGRIASADAIQALRKAAEPGGKLFHRKPTGVRLAAIAGLHAAGPTATAVLKELLEDPEREVRDAVQRALTTLWE
jgi:HEAT repeat protein